ncbi:uncharacterized protein B0H18DRAFT_1123394 [Fomitopsis serialis]|uniref:uncharacterized protein n=1 Tax=Fomitopsis serialis TaxID=139415 RepID=UPI002008AD67|nr:uncharacterized protein B0H18DRAFT_1123394 [Neoantrodia serialis]KAH9917777.1 hypothetical protein B0H18DRAFT_1123394 [Neoantrodia serialis]
MSEDGMPFVSSSTASDALGLGTSNLTQKGVHGGRLDLCVEMEGRVPETQDINALRQHSSTLVNAGGWDVDAYPAVASQGIRDDAASCATHVDLPVFRTFATEPPSSVRDAWILCGKTFFAPSVPSLISRCSDRQRPGGSPQQRDIVDRTPEIVFVRKRPRSSSRSKAYVYDCTQRCVVPSFDLAVHRCAVDRASPSLPPVVDAPLAFSKNKPTFEYADAEGWAVEAYVYIVGMPKPRGRVKRATCMLYLEHDDIAHISNGELHIHQLWGTNKEGRRATPAHQRNIETLEIELAEIMKGNFDH